MLFIKSNTNLTPSFDMVLRPAWPTAQGEILNVSYIEPFLGIVVTMVS